MLTVPSHSLLDVQAFQTQFPSELQAVADPNRLKPLMSLTASAPMQSSDEIRQAVRAMLRLAGFKPTGRSKPASEYLIKAVSENMLGPINLAVDACNVASLHSGLPISVVDLDQVQAPLRIQVAEPGTSYVFNASGQSIDVGGLLCLFDAQGPCANAVKDSQRTKTCGQTRSTLSIVWGTSALPGRAAQTVSWYRSLLESAGAITTDALCQCEP